jgi:hypothetical protein
LNRSEAKVAEGNSELELGTRNSELILEPARPASLLAVLESLEPLEETFPRIDF